MSVTAGARRHRVLIIGGGHGGANAVAFLRQAGYDGEILLVGEEQELPYHRPPLSKACLTSEVALQDLYIKPPEFYAEQDVRLLLGCRVTRIDAQGKSVEREDGSALAYDALVLATGSRPRRLTVPGAELDGVLALRTLGDSALVRQLSAGAGRVVLVGGGYIGLEVAAACRSNGADVTIVEREERVLPRVGSVELSKILSRHHVDQGSTILTSANVEGFRGTSGGAVSSVVLGDGSEIECGLVLVGVGAMPCDELARDAGITCDGGVIVDDQSRTSEPSVFAIGDVARRPLPGHPGLVRMESIASAVEQAKQAADAIVGNPPAAPEVPWFWSDQFGLKVKMAGALHAADGVFVRQALDATAATILHTEGRRLVGLETINAAADFMIGKQLIRKGTELDLTKLADASVPLKTFTA